MLHSTLRYIKRKEYKVPNLGKAGILEIVNTEGLIKRMQL